MEMQFKVEENGWRLGYEGNFVVRYQTGPDWWRPMTSRSSLESAQYYINERKKEMDSINLTVWNRLANWVLGCY